MTHPGELSQANDPELAMALRTAMRRLPSGVMLVTSADDDGTPHGMAASSVVSVSMDPPSMLVAVNRDASIHPVLARARRFCVNLLGREQASLLEPFSRSAQRHLRFVSGDWKLGPRGIPYLPDAPAAVFCEIELFVDYGTHTICVGRVGQVSLSGQPEPLVWLDGRPHRAVPDTGPD